MNDPAASSGVSSSLLSRHSVLDLACPVPDTGESSRVFWIPAFAGMTNSPQAAGNTTLREFKKPLKRSDIKMLRIILDIFFQQAIVKPKSSPVRVHLTGPLRVTIRRFFSGIKPRSCPPSRALAFYARDPQYLSIVFLDQ